MRKFLQIAGPLYVIFAIFVAHSSLVAIEAAPAHSITEGRLMVATGPTILNSERLCQLDAEADKGPDCDGCTKCKISKYRIEVWTASWCGPCKRWKQKELPILLKAGATVVLRDIDKEEQPDDVKSVPTMRVYYKDKFIKQKTYWRASPILKFIKQRKTDA